MAGLLPSFPRAVRESRRASLGPSADPSSCPVCSSASSQLNRNPFLEAALSYALTYIASHLAYQHIHPSTVVILADNSYYSETAQSQPSRDPRFATFSTTLPGTHKTGLGSSAALVTAFTAALLIHYLPPETYPFPSPASLSLLHNLSQASHCAAQGKVGSGFDIASAVYGSSLYRRFSPSLLQRAGEPGNVGFAERLKDLVEDPNRLWDVDIQKDAVNVPRGLRLVLCDVDCGSKTPGMVKQVLAWREAHPEEAHRIFDQLQTTNDSLAFELSRLSSTAGEDRHPDYSRLRSHLAHIRLLLRSLSTATGVPIEPPAQTALLDACSELPGVVGGVVPGAGGFDAVALLAEDRDDVIDGLRHFLERWKGRAHDDGPGRVRLLTVREDIAGIRVEHSSQYQSWIQMASEAVERN